MAKSRDETKYGRLKWLVVLQMRADKDEVLMRHKSAERALFRQQRQDNLEGTFKIGPQGSSSSLFIVLLQGFDN